MAEDERRIEEVLVSDIMTSQVVTAKPEESIVDAAKKMAENGVGSLVIVDDKGYVLGIITEGDIVRRVVAAGKDPASIRVGEVMTTNPVTIFEDATIAAAAELMKRKNIGHLPVVSSSGRLVGIVSRTDIVRIAPSFIELLWLRGS
ncbi:MAG: CBS domain-containing protein [Thermoproteota archaeon]